MPKGVFIRSEATKERLQALCHENCKKAAEVTTIRRNLSLEMKSILDGVMLSDGNIQKSGRLAVEQKRCRVGYLEFLNRKFGATNKVCTRDRFDKRTGKVYYSAYTQISGFRNQRKRWYSSGIKCLPLDLIITPATLLHWFIGDGSAHYNADNYTKHLTFSTQSFSSEEVERLQELLGVEFGCGSWVDCNRVIHINAPDMKKIYTSMGLCPVPCYSYKWELLGRL